jgi:SPP1 gp7 family putative phage head morphogenesis protein
MLTAAKSFRAELLRGDAEALRRLAAAYSLSADYLGAQLAALLREIDRARASGQTVDESWLRRQARFDILLRQVEAELARFAASTAARIQARQGDLVVMAERHTSALIRAAGVGVSFARLPVEAFEELVGNLSDGSPLRSLLDELGPEASAKVRRVLITALAGGEGPRKVAARFREALGGSRVRVLTIARTESLRAYRQSTLRIYKENSDVVEGWTWLSTLSTRTCAACWAMHGRTFPLSKEFFPGHVNCRCTSVPVVKGVTSEVTSGAEVFAEMDEEGQRQVLGELGFELYSSGVPLSEFVSLERSRKWGDAYVRRPVGQIQKRRAA